MTFVLLVIVTIVVAVVLGAMALARQGRRDVERDAVTGEAAAWAGQHTPEAKLHRRLHDAVAALPAEDPNVLEARLAIEEVVRAVDAQLVSVSKLPERVRAQPLAQVTAAVEAVEDGVARVAANELGAHGAAGVEAALAQLQERMALLAEAHRELDEGGTAEA